MIAKISNFLTELRTINHSFFFFNCSRDVAVGQVPEDRIQLGPRLPGLQAKDLPLFMHFCEANYALPQGMAPSIKPAHQRCAV